MRTKSFLLFTLVVLCLPVFAQTNLQDLASIRGASNQVIKAAKVEIPDKRALVMLNPDYSVTPGDAYTVHYLYDLKKTSLPFFIESDYTANLSFFGKLNVKGRSFRELKVAVEKLVLKAYPDSLPTLVIDSVGAFPVLVTGEVGLPGYAQAWGLSRLSDAIADRLTKYSSIRDVEVISDRGVSSRYDLYAAALTTDLAKNPVVHPGDRIVVHRLQREVFVKGQVYREGAFQILPGEQLRTTLTVYAGGLTNSADRKNAYLLRFFAEDGTSKTVYLDLSLEDYRDLELRDLDVIVIPGLIEKLPIVYFEGALFMKPGTSSPISSRVPWPITQDQRISTALANLPDGAITPVSDLERSFIIRAADGSFEYVNLQAIYYDHDLSRDVALKEGDRIVIPTKFFTVFVGGAVQNPGPQPYVAGKTYLEYVQLAGGFDPDLTTGRRVRILDRDGRTHGIDRIIQAEDKIYVPKNHPRYLFTGRLGPIIVTTAAIVTLILSFDELIDALK